MYTPPPIIMITLIFLISDLMKLRTSRLSPKKNLFIKQNLLTDNGTGKFSLEFFLKFFKITCLVSVLCLSIQNQHQFEKHYCKFQFFENHFDGHVTPVAGPIFGSLPPRDISKSEFKNEV